MAGINQTIMMALSMVIIASMVGAGGLGNDVLASIQRLDIGLGFESGLAVVCWPSCWTGLLKRSAPNARGSHFGTG
jgi:ABC-type proline/glycine betaine transport system permease subunit